MNAGSIPQYLQFFEDEMEINKSTELCGSTRLLGKTFKNLLNWKKIEL